MSDNSSDKRFQACLPFTLAWEGGFSNDPGDPGGRTMHGITQTEFNIWRTEHKAAHGDVKNITADEVQAIYYYSYWLAAGCDKLPAGLDLAVFDAAVNNGVHRASEWMEESAAFSGLGQGKDAAWIDDYMDARLDFDQSLGRLWRLFGTGWTRRIAGIREQAKIMAGVPEAEA